jgi:hypothetical protein
VPDHVTAALLSVLAASVVGSPHCAGMCGPLAVLAVGPDRRARNTVAYHAARLAGYLVLGAGAGLVGAGIDRAGTAAGIARAAAIVAGFIMVVWGAVTVLRWSGVRLPALVRPSAEGGPWTALAARLRGRPPMVRAAGLGVLSAALPCGWLWIFVAMAGASGRPLDGAVVMAVFFAGTLPAFAVLGLAAQRAAGPLRRYLPLVTGTILVVAGLMTMAKRGGLLHTGGRHGSPPAEVHDGHQPR